MTFLLCCDACPVARTDVRLMRRRVFLLVPQSGLADFTDMFATQKSAIAIAVMTR